MRPKHVAIVMDGNGRWAKQKGLMTIQGHRAGADVARLITEKCAQLGVEFLTLYTFSYENWKRDMGWIEDFLGLLRWFFKDQLKDLMANGVRIRCIGDRARFPKDIQDLIETVEKDTQNNTAITVQLALSYSGRNEIVRSIQKIMKAAQKGALQPHEFTEEQLSQFLDTSGVPDPDLVIRTSGEKRISNFLLWQMAYSELVFVDKHWPDFTPQDLEEAFDDFCKRQRRYGS